MGALKQLVARRYDKIVKKLLKMLGIVHTDEILPAVTKLALNRTAR